MSDLSTSIEAAPPTGRILVALCTLNESQSLPNVITLLNQSLSTANVLVVDDNSPDGCGRWAAEQAANNPQLQVIIRPEKMGLGSALRDAIRWCLEREYDYFVNLDADMSHDPLEVAKLLVFAKEQQADVAIGSRYIAGGRLDGLSFSRRLISRALNRYATWILRLPVKDCSSSFRCYRVSELRRLNLDELKCNGYGFLEEILVAMYRQGSKLVEYPIRYDQRQGGQSKLSLSDAYGALCVIHKLRGK